MRELYKTGEANYPRLATDRHFADYENESRYNGILDKTMGFVEDFQLLNEAVWKRFVFQFKQEDADHENGWRGEYWGKMMRGACFVYSYTRNEALYQVLKNTVLDMLSAADELGRISSYHVRHEFQGWDMWCRKYVLLGMQYFLEICREEDLKERIIASMQAQAGYIISKVGPREAGKTPIGETSNYWYGMNACSLLEPIVRLYALTNKAAYFDFAEYIVNYGGCSVENLFRLAEKDELLPYQYPVTKAYEMISCFEGLLEFYRITGIQWYKTAIVNFANRILESDFTVIGSGGCTHELFDHSTVRQANTTNGSIQQETCVTVTMMKFFYQLNLLTGDARYADAFETSLYNAYLGAVNTEKATEPTLFAEHPDWIVEPLPFDSYSPLTLNRRGRQIGGLKVMSDNHYYGCCACIGSAGIGLVPKMHLMTTQKGFAMNLYIDGQVTSKTPAGHEITFKTETAYPKDGTVRIVLSMEQPEEMELRLRIPAWSEKTCLSCNGQPAAVEQGYTAITTTFADGDVLELSLDMRTFAVKPIPYSTQILMNKTKWGPNFCMLPNFDREDPLAQKHIALRRGPLMLAKENRLGYDVEAPMALQIREDGTVDAALLDNSQIPYDCILGVTVPLKDGTCVKLSDYASAGKLWTEENKMAVWLLTE